MTHVKRPSVRQQKSALTRRRMLQSAYDLFCERGYNATTMGDIAERAGVAVQTLYFTFHTKDELLQAVQDWTVMGDEPIPPQQQEWYAAAVGHPDARRLLGRFVQGVAVINARVAPLVPVFHSVAADPAGDVYRQAEELRREAFAAVIGCVASKVKLRPGMTRARATDLLFVLGGPESYRSFVLEAGWSEKQWVNWVSATLCHDLFGDP